MISSFYGYCVDELPHIVPSNPMRKVARPEVSDESMTSSLSLDEARRLVAASEGFGRQTHAP